MLRLAGIHHVAIICRDYETSKQFYTETLGLTIIEEVYRADRQSHDVLGRRSRHRAWLRSEPPDGGEPVLAADAAVAPRDRAEGVGADRRGYRTERDWSVPPKGRLTRHSRVLTSGWFYERWPGRFQTAVGSGEP